MDLLHQRVHYQVIPPHSLLLTPFRHKYRASASQHSLLTHSRHMQSFSKTMVCYFIKNTCGYIMGVLHQGVCCKHIQTKIISILQIKPDQVISATYKNI